MRGRRSGQTFSFVEETKGSKAAEEEEEDAVGRGEKDEGAERWTLTKWTLTKWPHVIMDSTIGKSETSGNANHGAPVVQSLLLSTSCTSRTTCS